MGVVAVLVGVDRDGGFARIACGADDTDGDLAAVGDEYLGDVMNVAFANGWIADEDGKVFIYYASADTRMHVATSTIDKLVDYCMNTPEDGLFTAASVETIKKLVAKNRSLK